MALRAGDWVEIRNKEEILKSLDKRGQLDGLPFMPQMFQYCSQRFQVYKSAHKTCDTINGSGGRRLPEAIHLELRCDGKAYGNCQAACLIFWKEAWLKPVDGRQAPAPPSSSIDNRRGVDRINVALCTEEDVLRATCAQDNDSEATATYTCQATQLPHFTTQVPWWDIRQYLEDYTSGNVSLGRILRGFCYVVYYHFSQPRMKRSGPPLRWLYDRIQSLWGGVPFPRRTGTIPVGQPTPASTLNLRPGDLVRVKSYKEILATLDTDNKNQGLNFDAELVPYCGGTYRVRAQVDRFINEKTGKMSSLRTPAVILENAWCQSRYSYCRMFCPRSIYSWWREVWLEKLIESSGRGEFATTIADRAAVTSAQARY